MLAVPYVRWSHEHKWAVVSIRFRCLRDHEHRGHGKYNTVAGDRPRLFNTAALLGRGVRIGITEGEIDAISAEACGIPAVGVPGAQSWQPHFREPFVGYREVLVFADGDDAGLKFAETVVKSLSNAKAVLMPPGQDVNSVFVQGGRLALEERIST
jgi:DNA primase